jgi:hypothetical protein
LDILSAFPKQWSSAVANIGKIVAVLGFQLLATMVPFFVDQGNFALSFRKQTLSKIPSAALNTAIPLHTNMPPELCHQHSNNSNGQL